MGNGSASARAVGEPEGRYANFFKVGHNAFEFLVDFGQLFPGTHEGHLHTRIVTSPVYVKELLETLKEAVDRYELTFGPIDRM